MSKKNKNKALLLNKSALRKQILQIFINNPLQNYNYKQIAKKLEVRDIPTKKLIMQMLDQLVEKEKIEEQKRGKYRLAEKLGYITGIVDLTRHGSAYIVSDELREDVFVSQRNLNRALHGDEVRVYLFARRKKRALQGEVVEIIKRSSTRFVGIIEQAKNFAFLLTSGKQMPYDIFIPLNKLNGAKDGDKAVAEIAEWNDYMKNPIGKIVEVLGKPGENDVEMHAILTEFDLPYRFEDNVQRSAQRIPEKITQQDIKERRDFRKVPTFTIDPADAKDFDDALSVQKTADGLWEIGIHIADVTHYVKPGTLVESEAYERATSVYLVDRVVPMLPERLSNFICSLRPNEDKLTYSAVFQIDDNAQIKEQWFGRTIIRSDRRFSYQEAQAVLDTKKGDFATELLKLDQLAKLLAKKRRANGAIAFDSIEVKFHLDENGAPTGIYFKTMKAANHLIEEFMLLANRKVAELIGNTGKGKTPKTFVYRVHDVPDPEKFSSFAKFIRRFGYEITGSDQKEIALSLNKTLAKAKGTHERNVVEQLAMRSMAKAEYSTQNIGHYGLAFPFYTHFTSPIRRYPDMMVHRLLDRYLNGGKSAQGNMYKAYCRHCSEKERKAIAAERASIKYKQVEFMRDKLGEIFDGMISGVTERGLFVEITDYKIEGMVMLKDLDDDYYVFDEKKYSLTGRHTRKRYQLGNLIKVQIVRTNLEKKQLDFIVASE